MVIYIWKMNLTLKFINNKLLTVPRGTLKFKKIMAATNWTIVMRSKKTGKVLLHNLGEKWTYKIALGIAKESLIDETHELICVIETSKIMIKNDKEEEDKEELPIG